MIVPSLQDPEVLTQKSQGLQVIGAICDSPRQQY